MLLPDHVVRVNEIIAALRDAEALYRELAAAAEGELRADLQALAAARGEMITGLEELVRDLGELPESRETRMGPSHRAAARLKAAVTGDAAEVAREATATAEAEIEARVRTALSGELPAAARTALERMLERLRPGA